jgi:hypothetical protein
MNRPFFVAVAVLFTISASYGQEMTNSQMTETINELERRVGNLEKIILSGKSTSIDTAKQEGSVDRAHIDTAKQEGSVDRAQWRKLKSGMKDADVRALLGEPLHVEQTPYDYTWRYSTGLLYSTVTFSNEGGVSSWYEPE